MSVVAVIVLGDLGRSPRIQYHALSLSKMKEVKEVLLIGYDGEDCIQEIKSSTKIREVRLSSKDLNKFSKIPFFNAIFKGFSLLSILYKTIMSYGPSKIDLTMIQNPPCIPAAFIAILFSFFYSNKVLIDWHNLGYKMFEEKAGPNSAIAKLSKNIEFIIAHACSYHICVSQAMKRWLQDSFYIHPTVIYDRPSDKFNVFGSDLVVQHDLFTKLKLTDEHLFPTLTSTKNNITATNANLISSTKENNAMSLNLYTIHTLLTIPSNYYTPIKSPNTATSITTTPATPERNTATTTDNIQVHLRADGAHILISATSWTPDENFDLLLDTMLALNQRLIQHNKGKGISIEHSVEPSSSPRVPFRRSSSRLSLTANDIIDEDYDTMMSLYYPKRFVLLITGKGPLKEDFMNKVTKYEKEGKLTYVAIKSLWLEPEDYPLLMGSADLGICMHTSTSGLDLPMKILDMYGSGLPVCAIKFPAIDELVKHGLNGYIFKTATELEYQLCHLFDIQMEDGDIDTMKILTSPTTITSESNTSTTTNSTTTLTGKEPSRFQDWIFANSNTTAKSSNTNSSDNSSDNTNNNNIHRHVDDGHETDDDFVNIKVNKPTTTSTAAAAATNMNKLNDTTRRHSFKQPPISQISFISNMDDDNGSSSGSGGMMMMSYDIQQLTPLNRLKYHASQIEFWDIYWKRTMAPIIRDVLTTPKPRYSLGFVFLKGVLLYAAGELIRYLLSSVFKR